MSIRALRSDDALSRATVVLLLVTLGLVAFLVYEAQATARAHRATAERALREYAAFAAWEFSNQARVELQGTMLRAFSEFAIGRRRGDASGPEALERSIREGVECGCTGGIRAFYVANLADSSLSTHPALPPGATNALREAVAAATHAAAAQPQAFESVGAVRIEERVLRMVGPNGVVETRSAVRAPAVRMVQVGGEPLLLVQEFVRGPDGAPTVAYGFATAPRPFVEPIFARVMARDRLLPRSLTKGLPTDSILTIRAVAEPGGVLFARGRDAEGFTASDTVGTRFGGMRVEATLLPAVADRLLIGGLPRSRLPVLLAVLAIAAGLVIVIVLQLRRQAELARLRTDFVSGVSHELRTPLAQIRLLAELLAMGQPPSEDGRRQSARIIDQEARRLSHLVQNVLSFSTAERRASSVLPVPTELSDEIAQIVDTFQPLARAERAAIRLDLEPGLTALVDRMALRQIVLNVLDNAVRYGPPGQTITVATGTADGWARVRVADEGPGIPEGERERVWQPYYRLERDGARTRGGSGIGLAVVRDLVEQHRGRASIHAAAGGGAEVRIDFPLAPRIEVDADDADAREAQPSEVRA